MRFDRFIYLFLLLLWLLATKSTKYIGEKKTQEISTEARASIRLILATGLSLEISRSEQRRGGGGGGISKDT